MSVLKELMREAKVGGKEKGGQFVGVSESIASLRDNGRRKVGEAHSERESADTLPEGSRYRESSCADCRSRHEEKRERKPPRRPSWLRLSDQRRARPKG